MDSEIPTLNQIICVKCPSLAAKGVEQKVSGIVFFFSADYVPLGSL